MASYSVLQNTYFPQRATMTCMHGFSIKLYLFLKAVTTSHRLACCESVTLPYWHGLPETGLEVACDPLPLTVLVGSHSLYTSITSVESPCTVEPELHSVGDTSATPVSVTFVRLPWSFHGNITKFLGKESSIHLHALKTCLCMHTGPVVSVSVAPISHWNNGSKGHPKCVPLQLRLLGGLQTPLSCWLHCHCHLLHVPLILKAYGGKALH